MQKLPAAFLLLFALLAGSARSEENRTITLRADLWCPYNCQPGSTNEGVLVDLARAAFEKAGYHVDYQLLNWARAVGETRSGSYDGVIGALQGDAPDFIFPDEMEAASRNCFYTRAQDSWTISADLEASLRQRVLGVGNAYAYGPPLDRYIERHRADGRISVLSGDDLFARNLEKLRMQHIDTLVEDPWVATYGLQQAGLHSDTIRQAGCISVSSIYIAFSPAHPERSRELARQLTLTIRQMRHNGELDRLLARYGVH
jgi:polar amino acid transport system substrate-binding protein